MKAPVVDTSFLPDPAANSANASSGGGASGRRMDTTREGSGPSSALRRCDQVLDLGRVDRWPVIRQGAVLQCFVGDLGTQFEDVAQSLHLVDGELLHLVGGVASLDARAELPALDRLGQDHRGQGLGLGGGPIGGVDLAVVEPAAAQCPDLVVGHPLDQLAQPGVGAEEVLPDEGPALRLEPLVLAVDGAVHLVDQHAVDVAGEQRVPVAAPDDLDHVPPGAAEPRLELLDDLPVAPHRAVEPLQVAVDHPGEVVQLLPGRQRDRPQRLRLVDLAVADEAPHPGLGGVVDPPVVQVLEEAGLVERVERPEPHRHRGELPVVGHQPRVGVAGQPAADLTAEAVEIILVEPVLQVGAGVDAGGGVALDVDMVAGDAVFLAPEEVVEPDLVQDRRRGEGRQVTADAVGGLVGPDHHHRRVPPDEAADPPLQVLVAGEPCLLGGGDGVDVRGGHRGWDADIAGPGPFDQLGHQELGTGVALGRDHRVERVEPLGGLLRIGVGELVGEPVDDHRCAASSPAPPSLPARRCEARTHGAARGAERASRPGGGAPRESTAEASRARDGGGDGLPRLSP